VPDKEGYPVSGSENSRKAALFAVFGFSVLFLFQVLLAAGVPLGKAAFGGASAALSPQLRAASALSAFLILGAIWTVLARSGRVASGRRGRAIACWLIWGFAALFSLSAFANFASSSPWERYGWGPFAVGLVACCVIVAMGRSDP
jgi:hypothetical protein